MTLNRANKFSIKFSVFVIQDTTATALIISSTIEYKVSDFDMGAYVPPYKNRIEFELNQIQSLA